MESHMKAALVRIGNSKGIRLPKPILEQCGIEDEVELEVEDDRLIVRPARAPRAGWNEAFAERARQGDDSLLDEGLTSSWDESEWRW
jgi:antitoxin MazE